MRLLTRPNQSLSQARPLRIAFVFVFIFCSIGLFWRLQPSLRSTQAIVGLQDSRQVLATTNEVQSDAITRPLRKPQTGSESEPANDDEPSQEGQATRQLHLLMHGPFSDVSLCKSVTSSLLLDYPFPVLLNWGAEIEANNDNLPKFEALLRYLDAMPSQRDDDLVLVVDPYNVWFQLRPETLLDRYMRIIAAARERTQSALKEQGQPLPEEAEHAIVFAAQRECWPWALDDPECTEVPMSTLSEDIYGPETDKYEGKERFPYGSFRQRFLNSGAYIGKMGAMRKLFARAQQMAYEDRRSAEERKPGGQPWTNWASSDWSTRTDQVIFQRMFQAQQSARNAGECTSWKDAREKCEFGVDLDYESSIVQANAITYGDMDWVRHEWLGENVTSPAPDGGEKYESRDLLKASRPFATLESDQLGWDEVPLYTNQYTNMAPVLFQHNMDADNLLRIGDHEWSKMWFHSRLRHMLDARMKRTNRLQIGTMKVNGEETRWLTAAPSKADGIGAYKKDGEFVPWQDICGQWAEDVYRDKQAPVDADKL